MANTKQKVLNRGRALAALSLSFLLLACGGGGSSNPATAPSPAPNTGATGFTYRAPTASDDGWKIGDLTNSDSATALEGLMDRLQDGEFSDLDALVIAHRGELVFEEVLRSKLDSFDADVGNGDPGVHALFSVSKSLGSVMVGVAIEQGFISGVEVPYLKLFPYDSYDNWDDRKADITLEDVLTLRIGLEWNEWDPPYEHADNQLFRFHDNNHDYSKGLLDLPMAHAPGERFAYNTVATTSLGQAIENSSPLSLVDFANTYLTDALQISSVSALETPTGLPDLGRGLFLHARDTAKFGQLMLDGGLWNGMRIVSAEWATASTRSHFEITWSEPENWDWQVQGYGYLWWVGHFELEGQRLETFSAEGHGGQLIMVVPQLELVVVINAHAYGLPSADPNQMFHLLRHFILPAFSGTD